jgi:hypothetical protein
VASVVVDLVKEKGRFLKEHLYGWVEIDDMAARQKVSHAFRDLRASSKKDGDENAENQEDSMDVSGHGTTDELAWFDTESDDDHRDNEYSSIF